MGGGLLIVFEGVEGAGKSTQVALLRQALEAEGREVVVTREPGGTPAGERIREVLLDPDSVLEPRAEALLFAAARAQLVDQVIRPALQRGATVLCDRYVESSIAYQGVARGLGREAVEAVNRFGTGGLEADAVVLLRLDPAEGLARASGRGEARAGGRGGARAPAARDRIERQDLDFHRRVAAAYLDLAAEHPDRFVVVDAAEPAERVAAEVRAAVDKLIGSR